VETVFVEYTTCYINHGIEARSPSKSPPKGETFKKCFKALSFGEGWVRLFAMTHFYYFQLKSRFLV
jgi:hypothetical protein